MHSVLDWKNIAASMILVRDNGQVLVNTIERRQSNGQHIS